MNDHISNNTISENHMRHIDSQLEKIITHLQNLEMRMDRSENKIVELQKNILEINNSVRNLDINLDELSENIATIENDITLVKDSDKQLKDDVKHSKNEINMLLTNFKGIEEENIRKILPPYQRTIEQNRLWRLYSNNFQKNVLANNDNLLKQLALNISIDNVSIKEKPI